MPEPLRNQDVRERLRDYSRDNYLFLGNVTKGIALGIAAVVLLQIVGHITSEWMRTTLWFSSLLGIVVTYVTTHNGILLTNSRANSWDSVLPLLMGMAEFLLFGILYIDNQQPILWLNWFFFLMLHALVGVAIVHNRIQNLNTALDYEDKSLAKTYQRSLVKNRRGAFIVAGLSCTAWMFVRWFIYPLWGLKIAGVGQCMLGALFSILLITIIRDSNENREKIDAHVSELFCSASVGNGESVHRY